MYKERVFWDVMLCALLNGYQHFWGTYYPIFRIDTFYSNPNSVFILIATRTSNLIYNVLLKYFHMSLKWILCCDDCETKMTYEKQFPPKHNYK